MRNQTITNINSKQLKNDITDFRVGDTVVVDVKIVEGKKERIQKFEGVVISRRNNYIGRKIWRSRPKSFR